MYLAHNYQFLAYSAAMEGRKAEALEAATSRCATRMPVEMLLMMPGADWSAVRGIHGDDPVRRVGRDARRTGARRAIQSAHRRVSLRPRPSPSLRKAASTMPKRRSAGSNRSPPTCRLTPAPG